MLIEKLRDYVTNLPENKNPKAEFRMSAAGDCPRKLDYDFQIGSPPVDAKSFFRMSLGHASHNFLRELLTQAYGEDFYHAENEIFVALPSGQRVTGHPDGRILSLKATIEIKSVSDSTFTMITNENKPIDAHIDQTNKYAVVQKDENCLILYVNRDSGEMAEFMFPASLDLFNGTINKFVGVEKRKVRGEIIARPYSNAQESPCWFCPWVKKCYEGFEREVSSMATARIEGDLAAIAREAVVQRTVRLSASKLEDAAKEMFGKEMLKLGINRAEVVDETGIIDAINSVGKNNNLLTSLKERKIK